jgi:hypothetical protein
MPYIIDSSESSYSDMTKLVLTIRLYTYTISRLLIKQCNHINYGVTKLWSDDAMSWQSYELKRLWSDEAMDWRGYGLTKLWTDEAMDWQSYGLTRLWSDEAMEWRRYTHTVADDNSCQWNQEQTLPDHVTHIHVGVPILKIISPQTERSDYMASNSCSR